MGTGLFLQGKPGHGQLIQTNIEQMRTWVEEIPTKEKADPILKEQVVDKITASIRQTAASGSHFSKMLTPEEEEIMREIIREFMD